MPADVGSDLLKIFSVLERRTLSEEGLIREIRVGDPPGTVVSSMTGNEMRYETGRTSQQELEEWAASETTLAPSAQDIAWPLKEQTTWAWLLQDFGSFEELMSDFGKPVELVSIRREDKFAFVTLQCELVRHSFSYALAGRSDLPTGVPMDFAVELIRLVNAGT